MSEIDDLNAFFEKYDTLLRFVAIAVIIAILIAIYGYLQQVELRCKQVQEMYKRCDYYCRVKYMTPYSNDTIIYRNITNITFG